MAMRYDKLTTKQLTDVKQLFENASTKREAVMEIVAKYKISESTAWSWHKKLRDNLGMELRKQTVGKNGDVLSQQFGKVQEEDDVDQSKFEPVAFTTNPFGKGKWIRYDKTVGYTPEELKAELDKRIPADVKITKKTSRKKAGVFMLADFHLGAYVGDLIKTPDFSYDIMCTKLQEVAETINSHKYKKVNIFLCGDFIESFTGLNHVNSWKGLQKGAYGMKAVILAHDILSRYFYSKVENLDFVGFVSGNHDRITSDKSEDQEGQVAMMMQYLFDKDFDVQSEWSPLLIRKVIDGIGYVVTHGHLGISNKEISKVLFDYGFQDHYNVFAKGHKHTRETRRHFKKSLIKYEGMDYVSLDGMNYRAVTVPPLFTGNFFSESLGFTSTAGFAHFVNNGKGKITYIDYSI